MPFPLGGEFYRMVRADNEVVFVDASHSINIILELFPAQFQMCRAAAEVMQ